MVNQSPVWYDSNRQLEAMILTRMILLVAIALSLHAPSSKAQDLSCDDVAFLASISADDEAGEILIREKCKIDTIVHIRTHRASLVARICNFEKSILKLETSILCVLSVRKSE